MGHIIPAGRYPSIPPRINPLLNTPVVKAMYLWYGINMWRQQRCMMVRSIRVSLRATVVGAPGACPRIKKARRHDRRDSETLGANVPTPWMQIGTAGLVLATNEAKNGFSSKRRFVYR